MEEGGQVTGLEVLPEKGRIVTPKPQWSYAWQCRIPTDATRLVLDLQVHQGMVSAGIVAEDYTTFLVDSEFAVFDEGPRVIGIVEGAAWLVIRNIVASVSECSIKQLTFDRGELPVGKKEQRPSSEQELVAERWAEAPNDSANWATIPSLQISIR